MRRFEVKLEAQDGSGHFRVVRLAAPSKEKAREHCERTEYAIAAWQLDEQRAAELLDTYAPKKVNVPDGEGRLAALHEALENLPKPAALDAKPEKKAPFLELDARARGLLQTHFQTEPYKVVSVQEVKD